MSYAPPITVSLLPVDLSSSEAVLDDVVGIVSRYVSRVLPRGVRVAHHSVSFVNGSSYQPLLVPLSSVDTGAKPYVALSHARASAFRVKPLADGDVIRALRNLDGPVSGKVGGKSFVRDSRRLLTAAAKAKPLANPSFVISEYQLPKPFSFPGGPPDDERPLVGPCLAAARGAAACFPPDVDYFRQAKRAIDLGDYTTHDPDTLPPRFLEYVHERIERVDAETERCFGAARQVLHEIWRGLGVGATARSADSMEPDALYDLLNSGSPGEYRSLGATDRRDPRLLKTMSDSLRRYLPVGAAVVTGRQPAPWVSTTLQPTLTFGKDEPKAAKIRDGQRVAPVPRFIFNLSPVNYALCAFLFSDLSHSLQELSPLHGPGYGPSRGRSGKFLDVMDFHFGGETRSPDHERMIMSDIDKWDANMCEFLLGFVFDTLEAYIDKSGLSSEMASARACMFRVARRQLLMKLVEHPSGYLVYLFGAMPSGSYVTSLVNTEGNNLLIIAHVISRMVAEGGYTHHGAALHLAPRVTRRLVSYGDNQLVSEHLFLESGLEYDPEKHAEFLSRVGMKLKLEETEVSNLSGRARFCSRGLLQTPHGPLVTRSHGSLYSKLAGRPRHHPVADKLYVRATMADHLGTDPIVFDILSKIDRSISVDIANAPLTAPARAVIAVAARSIFGDTTNDSVDATTRLLTSSSIDRLTLLSLHTSHLASSRGDLGLAATFGTVPRRADLTPAAQWVSDLSPREYSDYLGKTGQLGLLYD